MRCMRSVTSALIHTLCAFVLWPSWAHADVVSDWSTIAMNAAASSGRPVARAAHDMAIVHVAVFETMNFVQGGYVSRLLVRPSAAFRQPSEAAAAAAAHYVLEQLYPGLKVSFDAALEDSLAKIPDRQKADGARLTGRAVGANIYAILATGETAGKTARARFPENPEVSRADVSAQRAEPAMQTWHSVVSLLAGSKRLRPIETARLYALVFMAMSDVYAGMESRPAAASRRCGSCTLDAAVLKILDSEFRTTGGAEVAVSRFKSEAAANLGARIGKYALAHFAAAD